jgi:phospholipid/cholesterol/gamma-HCH transport system substrate-binding protein
METKANNIVIGSVAIVLIAAMFFFVIWLGQIQLTKDYTTYDTYFRGSVSGLSVASEVRYNGISVGNVKGIYLDDKDPNLVLVRLEVDAQTPVKTDTIAQMAFLGVTGVSFVELTGGSIGGVALVPRSGATYAEIETRRSVIQEVMESAPNIVAQSNLLLLQGSKLLSDENVSRVSNVMKDLETVVGAIAERDEDIGEMIAHAAATSQKLDAMAEDIASLARNANTMMEGDLPEMVSEILSAASSIDDFATKANTLLTDNEASISQFTSQGLGDLNSLLAEARVTIATLERLAAAIEEDPTILLGQEKYPEYDAN